MKTDLSHSNADALRKKEKEEIVAQISSMGLSAAIAFLKKSFRCSAEKGGHAQKKEYLNGTKTFFGKLKITNQCQFHPSTAVDIRHIAGYCCNNHFDMCPLYQLYTCTNTLISGIRR